MIKLIQRKKGFTLIELLVVVGIMAVLISLGTVAYSKAQSSARDTKRKTDLRDIKAALYAYQTVNGTFCDPNPSMGCNNYFMQNAAYLSSYFKGGVIPQDPFHPTDNNKNYYLTVLSSSSFVLSATMENAPSTTDVGCLQYYETTSHDSYIFNGYRNYCISE